MKGDTLLVFILLVAFLSACGMSASGDGQPSAMASLTVSGGEASRTYTRADLQALASIQSTFNDISYVGVSVASLLQDAGFNLDEVKAVKALASDGYAVNYDPSQLFSPDVIVAYAQADAALAAEDGPFRMVLPGAEGKLNVRMLVELQVIK